MAGGHDLAVALDPAGRWNADHRQPEIARAFGRIGEDIAVGIILRRHRNGDDAGRHKARQIIDMAIGMIVHQPFAEPQHPVDAQIAPQVRFDLGPGPSSGCGWG